MIKLNEAVAGATLLLLVAYVIAPVFSASFWPPAAATGLPL